MLFDVSLDLRVEAFDRGQGERQRGPPVPSCGVERGLSETSARPGAGSAERTSPLSSVRVSSLPDQLAGRSVHSAYSASGVPDVGIVPGGTG